MYTASTHEIEAKRRAAEDEWIRQNSVNASPDRSHTGQFGQFRELPQDVVQKLQASIRPADAQPNEMERNVLCIHESLDRLSGLVSVLADRLAPVLQPEPPEKESGISAMMSSSPLGQELERTCSRIDHLTDRIGTLLQRAAL